MGRTWRYSCRHLKEIMRTSTPSFMGAQRGLSSGHAIISTLLHKVMVENEQHVLTKAKSPTFEWEMLNKMLPDIGRKYSVVYNHHVTWLGGIYKLMWIH